MINENEFPRFDFTQMTVEGELIIDRYLEIITEEDRVPSASFRRVFLRVLDDLSDTDMFSMFAEDLGEVLGEFYEQYMAYYRNKRDLEDIMSSIIDPKEDSNEMGGQDADTSS